MKVFLICLFFIFFSSNNAYNASIIEIIPEVKNVTLPISTIEETYFYVNNTFLSGYFDLIFFENGTNFSISDVCFTDTDPSRWKSSYHYCYGAKKLNLSYERSFNEINEKHYKYNFYLQGNYLVIKYNVSNTNNILNVTVNITEIEKPTDSPKTDSGKREKDSDGAQAIIIILVIVVGIPVVIIIIIVICVCVGVCVCCSKKTTQPMPGYYQPPMTVPNSNPAGYPMAIPSSNPAGYPMVTQAPPIQENLLYTKPE